MTQLSFFKGPFKLKKIISLMNDPLVLWSLNATIKAFILYPSLYETDSCLMTAIIPFHDLELTVALITLSKVLFVLAVLLSSIIKHHEYTEGYTIRYYSDNVLLKRLSVSNYGLQSKIDST